MVLKEGHQVLILNDHISRAKCIRQKFYSTLWRFVCAGNINKIIGELEPDEIYNLVAQSHVAVSFDTPEYTSDVMFGTLRILDPSDNSLTNKCDFIRRLHRNYMD